MDPILINGDHIVAILIALFGSTGFWTWLSSRLNKTNNTQTAETLKAVKDLKTEFEMERAITARRCILNFNGELLEGRRHTKESFDQILSDIDSYERYCRNHPEFQNNKTVLSTEHIKKIYMQCEEKSAFLS